MKGQGHIFRTQMRANDGNKTEHITYLTDDRDGSSKDRMRENLTSGSVKGIIITSELLLQ